MTEGGSGGCAPGIGSGQELGSLQRAMAEAETKARPGLWPWAEVKVRAAATDVAWAGARAKAGARDPRRASTRTTCRDGGDV